MTNARRTEPALGKAAVASGRSPIEDSYRFEVGIRSEGGTARVAPEACEAAFVALSSDEEVGSDCQSASEGDTEYGRSG